MASTASVGSQSNGEPSSPFESPTFEKDVSIHVSETIGAASISPSGRDVVLASRNGLNIIDLDNPYSPPLHIANRSQWDVADVQWSPFADRASWIASTSNQKALIYNLDLLGKTPRAPIQYTLHAHTRAITDINFSAHHPDELATCAVDSFVHCWDLRQPGTPALTFNSVVKFAKPFAIFADWDAGATQVKWNRQDPHIIASSHDRYLRIWDRRNGALPLKTITAHSTKIYGIDWNRTRSTGILTCSLDKTIKLWDYSKGDNLDLDDSHAERIFRTPYPVWRARHTPFGWGVLAMPQRGNYDLHLYDRRLSAGMKKNAVVPPTHSFEGHSDCVKEFLWRSRGSIEDGIDNRDFQLVSWGTDRYLHLHKMNSDILKTVGFEKGKEVFKKPYLTRVGAAYLTYRDGPPIKPDTNVPLDKEPEKLSSQAKGHLTTLFQTSQSQKDARTAPFKSMDHPTAMVPVGMRGKNRARKIVNTIKWMEGVKIGNRDTDTAAKWGTRGTVVPPPHQFTWDSPESLGDEITYVGGRYRKVAFEEVDVARRKATVSLYGPWGVDRKAAFIRISLKFPLNYPRDSAPDLIIEKTTAAIADETILKLDSEMHSIAELYLNRKRGSLEAIVGYALGERGLEESIDFLEIEEDSNVRGLDRIVDDDSSSDEEDDDLTDLKVDFEGAVDLERSGNDIPVNIKANVPLPKHCGAMWSEDGRLVCFFPPPPEPRPLFSVSGLRPDRLGKSWSIFDTFGRLNAGTSGPGTAPGTGEEDHASLHDSWTSSSSTSSSSSSDADNAIQGRRFQPPAAWRRATLKFQKSSQVSSAGQGNPIQPKSIVSIKEVEEHLLPCKKVLAKEYKIFGDGPTVCAHNADVARKHGFQDLAEVWDICKLILCNDVPLEILPQQYRREQVLVLARRSLVKIRRKDSGIDLAFDDPEKVAKPRLTGRVKWGRSPIVTFLIPALFDHFEALADTQMLAMLSCIFSEPAANEGVTSAMQRLRQSDLPMSMEAPAFSLDYFSSAEAAWSLFRRPQSIPGTPSYPPTRFSTPVNSWERLDKRLDTFGSAGSSNGPWGSDHVPSDPATPYSTGHTPPTLSRTTSTHRSTASATQSYSTSPEQHQQIKKSNSNLATALATLSRPFSITASSSPPANPKPRGEGDLSTSAPTSGITWGTNTFYSSSNATNATGRSKHGKRPSISQLDGSYLSRHSEEDEDRSWIEEGSSEPALPSHEIEGDTTIKVTLKNQDHFDDEGCVSAPLLDRSKEWLYRHYREQYAEQLSIWNLIMQRAEILKFNGLVSYWPEKKVERPSTQEPTLEVGTIPHIPDQQAAVQRPGPDRRVSNDSLLKIFFNFRLAKARIRIFLLSSISVLVSSHIPSLFLTLHRF
ncbi:WD40 repeat-like protein [Lophium mytilinum]|uniref:WD40 repeat-like protein n=1 Tax=Lophium mytilinum TaxID=390894 RepID=A0A6A6R433_9PEZI|nr:WD40 repeat-like protein [Lophium mytilinum]